MYYNIIVLLFYRLISFRINKIETSNETEQKNSNFMLYITFYFKMLKIIDSIFKKKNVIYKYEYV